MCIKRSEFFWAGLLLTLLCGTAGAQPIINGNLILRGGAPVGPGQVALPYIASSGGEAWYVYADGALRQQTGQPVYQEGARLSINGAMFTVANNQGTVDAKTGELIL